MLMCLMFVHVTSYIFVIRMNECNNQHCEVELKTRAINTTNTRARTDAFMIVAPFFVEDRGETLCMVTWSVILTSRMSKE